MTKPLLAVDVGNTSVYMALYKNGWKPFLRIKTSDFKKSIPAQLVSQLKKTPDIDVVIGSVVPGVTQKLRSFFKKSVTGRVVVAGSDVAVPIKNRYKNPKQVGMDRLLNALAGYRLHKKAMIIIDFGTAITFDVVSKKGEYLGGVIAPGIEISLDALFERTALLPKTKLKHPASRIGRDTIESIRIGCSYGIGGLCERLTQEVSKDLGGNPKIIATGGYASFMKKYCPSIQQIYPNLTMDGLRLTYLAI